ncbi:MAG: hypothetical protein JEZ06_13695 [Anaerolineaceae bacterium]|nr:hypothetical protein [Anaerolineaceae bacterium]
MGEETIDTLWSVVNLIPDEEFEEESSNEILNLHPFYAVYSFDRAETSQDDIHKLIE